MENKIVLTLTQQQHIDIIIAIQDRLNNIKNDIEKGKKHMLNDVVQYWQDREKQIQELENAIRENVQYQ